MSEVNPEGFMVDGKNHEWNLGRIPKTDKDWRAEYRLQLKQVESYLDLAVEKNRELKELQNRLDALAEQNAKLAAARNQPAFHLGKRPETPEEIDAEVRLRETERRWEVELADRRHRADLAYEQSGLVRRAEDVRGWALVAVVFAIIASPWIAMIAGVAAKDFSLYVAPVTGIAGAIIGYWFGQGQRNDLQPPTIANSPTVIPRAESP
ncbi:hypothetical protein OKJ48_42250 [Streptomyces kunmingensis]|uniref:DUF1707 domain-containing protein n=1 Tax=Streptomyces kunmingensis TaxID=68225 RepID=A0ABU6CR10_9ACTN|nr:hypothetical protein [Streptomyces kunmingensis]MEB3966810.1 hypothetical protein [Streptomyces kunmingensis]